MAAQIEAIDPWAELMKPIRSGGVGKSVRRREDARFLRGQGEFVADNKRFGMREVAFLRSPLAHGKNIRITKPADKAGDVFIAADLGVTVDRLPIAPARLFDLIRAARQASA